MKAPFLALAAVLVVIAGASTTSFAQDSGSAAETPESRFRQLVVEPKGLVVNPAPIETPAVQPKIALPPDGIETPGDTGEGETQTLPIIVQPEGTPAPQEEVVKADPVPAEPPAVQDDPLEFLDETPAAKAAKPAPKVIVGQPPKVAPAAAPPAEEDSVVGAAKLYDVLKSRGYDIKVEKGGEYGQYVFYVTKEGYEYSNLLVVDGEYGKVLKRQKTKLAKTYQAPKTYENDSYEEPAYKAPVYKQPAYKAPAYKAPAYEEPAYEDGGYGNDSYGNSGSSGY